MKITLNTTLKKPDNTTEIVSTELVSTQSRNSTGLPVGPANFRASDAPGVVKREYIGADRIHPEHIRCDSGTITFDVNRTFATVAEAVQYALNGIRAELVEGELKADDTIIFAHAAVTSRSVAMVGCTVAVSYTIEG